ncbi:TonB-dependent receptor [Muricauda oceani]|uniref:TonB-dependent receptor n=1 Tax=Flagellimonas oceani TaxID=2698672 RepID=A0A6G7IZU9_9FLAO|nr:TonB-dependent receptor [Allomuricauda oceani]MBW8244277.1 TonB-dependent receptor [Allomuricauda oceani]QII44076.1 TonB-dependent receptor [Allomuricauda oceani]
MQRFLILALVCIQALGVNARTSASFNDTKVDKNVRLSLEYEGNDPREVLELIQRKTGYRFAYDAELIRSIRKHISIKVDNSPLGDVLAYLMAQIGLEYEVNGKSIILYKPKPIRIPQSRGTIGGKVYDADNPGEPLMGATVQVEGSQWATVTDFDGMFELKGLPEGEYSLLVRYVGFVPQRLEHIGVIGGNRTEIEVAMVQGGDALDEVVVTADINVKVSPIEASTEESLVKVIQEASGIVTGISNFQIAQSMDRDAGDVVKRVPGVSVLDEFVIVRGMSKRYNLTMLNGMTLPSAEMDTRAFNLNLLPTGIIDRIMVYKSPSPELPGNFGGGVVKIQTKNSSTARRFQMGVSTQYREGSSFTDHIGYKGSGKDWYGGGVEDRQLPALLRDPSYTLPPFGQYPGEVTEMGKSLPDVRLPEKQHHDLDVRANFNYYDSWKLTDSGIRLNNLTALSYTNERQFIEKKYTEQAESIEHNEETGEWTRGRKYLANDSIYLDKLRFSAMENLNLVIGNDHSIAFNSFFNRSVNDQVLVRQGNGIGGSYDNSQKTYSYEYQRRDLYQLQLAGSHAFDSHSIEWSAGINQVEDYTPDLQRFNYTNNSVSDGNQWFYLPGGLENARIDFHTKEKGKSAHMDYTRTYETNKEGGPLKIKAGVYWKENDRIFTSGRYQIEEGPNAGPNSYPNMDEAPWDGLIKDLHEDYFSEDGTGLILVQSADPGKYSIDDEVRAFYASIGLPLLGNKLVVNGGVRYEWNERFVYDENGNQRPDSVVVDFIDGHQVYERTPDRIQKYWLPSMNVAYHLSKELIIKGSYGKTVDRPQYREQSNFNYFDFEMGSIIYPNILLKDATIDNYDLRFELYPGPSEFIAVGGFYKRLTDAIERSDVSDSSWNFPAFKYGNTDEAKVYGIEAEVRKNLGFIDPFMEYFSLIVNASWLKSEVKIEEEVGSVYGGAVFDRPMQGTSPYIVNAGLYFDHRDSGTKTSVVYNLTGPRLYSAPPVRSQHGGLYEQRRHVLDLSLSQRITKAFSVKAGVQNLLNSPIQFYKDENLNNKPNKIDENPRVFEDGRMWNDYVEREWKEGAYFSLGLNFEF